MRIMVNGNHAVKRNDHEDNVEWQSIPTHPLVPKIDFGPL